MTKFDGSSTISYHYKQFLWHCGFQLLSGQQTKNWKSWYFWLIFASTGVNVCCFGSNAGLAATSDPSRMNIQLTSFRLAKNMSESQPQYLESKAVANIQQLLPQKHSFPTQKLGAQTPRTIPSSMEITGVSKSLDFSLYRENPSGNISPPQSHLKSHLKFKIQNFAQTPGFIPVENLKSKIQNPKLVNWVFNKKQVTISKLYSQLSPPPASLPTIAQPTPATPPEVSPNPPGGAEPPQLESQPNILPSPTTAPIQQPLPPPLINGDPELGILKLQQQPNLTPFPSQGDVELGNLHLRLKPSELGNLLVRSKPDELGIIRVRPLRTPPEVPPPQIEPPPPRPQPVAYLLARSSYFWTNNIFSSVDPVDDGLIWTGLTLAAAPIRLGPQTFVNLSADGSIIRYIDQSLFNYNQVRFNAGLYQQLSSRMFGEIGWNNQQLFTAETGDRFLNENSLRLLVGRRDFFSRRLVLDSFYEFRLNFADPLSRSRIINTLWLSLSYYLQSTWQVGLDYQFSLSNFTQREREDQLHRLMARLTYQTSANTNVTLQGGWSLGGSTEPSIDFNSLFFSVTFSLELGRF